MHGAIPSQRRVIIARACNVFQEEKQEPAALNQHMEAKERLEDWRNWLGKYKEAWLWSSLETQRSKQEEAVSQPRNHN